MIFLLLCLVGGIACGLALWRLWQTWADRQQLPRPVTMPLSCGHKHPRDFALWSDCQHCGCHGLHAIGPITETEGWRMVERFCWACDCPFMQRLAKLPAVYVETLAAFQSPQRQVISSTQLLNDLRFESQEVARQMRRLNAKPNRMLTLTDFEESQRLTHEREEIRYQVRTTVADEWRTAREA